MYKIFTQTSLQNKLWLALFYCSILLKGLYGLVRVTVFERTPVLINGEPFSSIGNALQFNETMHCKVPKLLISCGVL